MNLLHYNPPNTKMIYILNMQSTTVLTPKTQVNKLKTDISLIDF